MKCTTLIVLSLVSLRCLCHCSLDYPIGGEQFDSGEMIVIQWSNVIMHDQVDWDLYYSLDGGNSWTTIAQGLPPTQFNYLWTVPEGMSVSGLIRIVQDNVLDDYDAINTAPFSVGIVEMVTAVERPIQLHQTTGNLEFLISTSFPYTLSMYDMAGKKLMCNTYRESQTILESDRLTPGLYIAILETKKRTYRQKFIISY